LGDAARCDCFAKWQKFHHNIGCCIVEIVRMKDVFVVN
jgi:hypothetical protein